MPSKNIECSICLLTSKNYKGDGFKNIDSSWYCPFCFEIKDKSIDYKHFKNEWAEMVKKLKNFNKNKPYDALLALSGGKDSCFALYWAVKNEGLKILPFLIDHGFLSPSAIKNILMITKKLKVGLFVLPDKNWQDFIVRTIKDDNIPCIKGCDKYKIDNFKQVANIFNNKFIITGSDIPRNNSIISKKNGVVIVRPLAALQFTEKKIFKQLKKLGWKKPKLSGYDTDCLAAGYALYRYNKKRGAKGEKFYLSEKIRFNKITRDEAKLEMRNHKLPRNQKVLVEKLINKHKS